MATFEGREDSFRKAYDSLRGQVDIIHVYDNSKMPTNLYDNGKFAYIVDVSMPHYFFTVDDDLLYPSNYIDTMIEGIEKHKSIVTHHGRILTGLNKSYYRGHKTFRCLGNNKFEGEIDVAGTGVTGFRTDYFNPTELHKSDNVKMSDIIFSLEAAKQKKKITILPHERGWIKQLRIDHSKSIHGTEKFNEKRQIELANEIYKLKYM